MRSAAAFESRNLDGQNQMAKVDSTRQFPERARLASREGYQSPSEDLWDGTVGHVQKVATDGRPH